MSEPEPVYKVDKPDKSTEDLLAMRSELISTLITLERMLESKGMKVETAIVTRQERRQNLTRQHKKK